MSETRLHNSAGCSRVLLFANVRLDWMTVEVVPFDCADCSRALWFTNVRLDCMTVQAVLGLC